MSGAIVDALTVCAGHVRIDILPDDVLLHIFRFESFNALRDPDRLWGPSWWHRLVQVCRRWLSVISAWPNFLDLKLVYGHRSCIKQPTIWPTLPIIMTSIEFGSDSEPKHYHEFDFAVVHRNHNRICKIGFHLTRWELEGLNVLISAMQEPFPALRRIRLLSAVQWYQYPPVPDGFLG